MARELLVFGDKVFKISIPDDSKVTFGPWSPPSPNSKYTSDKTLVGTLRVYKGSKTTENILAVFSGVTGFRELSLEYSEQIAKEEGATIWKSDNNGYSRQENVSRSYEWGDNIKKQLPAATESTYIDGDAVDIGPTIF